MRTRLFIMRGVATYLSLSVVEYEHSRIRLVQMMRFDVAMIAGQVIPCQCSLERWARDSQPNLA